MITQREFIMIHELNHAIARITGKDRKIIRAHLQKAALEAIQRTNTKPLKLDAFKDYILDRISKSSFRIPSGVILKEIMTAGYTGSLRILQELLQVEYGKRVKPDPVVRFETAPGYQAQVDWTTIRSGKNPIYAFVMTLGYSRASFVYFTTDMESSTLIDCHHKAFAYFGGVPKTILFDNMRTVVDKCDAYGEGQHRFNEQFYELPRDYGFTIKLCQPYRARTKGKVERFNNYLKGNFYRPLVITTDWWYKMNPGINLMAEACDTLKLSGILQGYQSIADECAKQELSYTDYLNKLLSYELKHRAQKGRSVVLKMAGFPTVKPDLKFPSRPI